uniref:DUF4408 domain-containing protein n=1 Tax=Kalanchoe fedtschenkoi TaxID=63787 RepID=A0A7N0RBV2_KALFE
MADLLARSTSFSSSGARLETAVWAAKLMLLSIGTVSTVLLFKVALIPCLLDLILPRALTCLRTWLSPPYIYIILNFIIISIAASSSFHNHPHPPSKLPHEPGGEPAESGDGKSESADVISKDVVSFFSTDAAADMVSEISEPEAEVAKQELGMSSDALSDSENSPPVEEEEGDSSYEDTLDGTWRAIMEGKGTVKKPLLKKSDTWNATRTPASPLAEVSNLRPVMRKWETFRERARTGEGVLRREALLSSQDSLTERVEAFINKCNNDMRMERQQSELRYTNMVQQAT